MNTIAYSATAIAVGVFVGELVTYRGRMVPSLITALICAVLAVILLLVSNRGIPNSNWMLLMTGLACGFAILGWLMGWIALMMFEFKIVPHDDTDTLVHIVDVLFWLFRVSLVCLITLFLSISPD